MKDFVANDDDKKVLDVIFISTDPGAALYRAARHSGGSRQGAARRLHGDHEGPGIPGRDRQKLQLNIDPTSGEEMERIVRDAYALPEAVIQKVRKALSD